MQALCAVSKPSGGEDAGLVRGVEAVDVEGRVRLGVAELLGVGEDFVERLALVLHAREDVVARAVEDAVDLENLVAGEPLAEAADDRDAAAHGRAEVDVHAVLPRRVEDLLAVFGEQLLVGGDHRLARVERRQDKRAGDARASDRLDHDAHGRVRDHGLRVRGEHVRVHAYAAVRRDVQIRDALQHDVHAQAFGHQPAVAQQTFRHAGADRAESKDSNSDFLHFSSPFRRAERTSAAGRCV